MKVRELGNRVWQIYAYTIFVGTVISIIGISIFLFLGGITNITSINLDDVFYAFMSFILSIITVAIILGIMGSPNVFILNLGLKYIYKNVKSEKEKRNYFIYLWIILNAIPLLIIAFFLMDKTLFSSPEELATLLLPLPYILSSLYYIFKINNKFDQTYPPDFSRNVNISVDILDDDF